MVTIALIFLTIGMVSGAFFLYKLKQEMREGFEQFALRQDNKDVIKAIESIDVKVDFTEVIKTVESGNNEILLKVDNQSETIIDRMDNLTIVIQE